MSTFVRHHQFLRLFIEANLIEPPGETCTRANSMLSKKIKNEPTTKRDIFNGCFYLLPTVFLSLFIEVGDTLHIVAACFIVNLI